MNGPVPSRYAYSDYAHALHEIECVDCNGYGTVVVLDLDGNPGGDECENCGGCGMEFIPAHTVGEAHA